MITIIGINFFEKWQLQDNVATRIVRIHCGRRDYSAVAISISDKDDFIAYMQSRTEPIKYIKDD